MWKFGNLGGTEMTRYILALTFVMAAAPALAQTAPVAVDPHAGHAMEQQAPAAPAAAPTTGPRNPNLPPPGDTNAEAVAQLEAALKSSPRKSESVDIKGSTGTPIKSFVVYPDRRDKAPVVVVIQEIFGLTDWIRGVADQVTKEGFIAIAPDFMSGMGPNKGGSAELGPQGSQREIGKLTDDDKVRILNDVRAYALAMPSANGKLGTVGFCWGGGTSFLYAMKQPALNAAVSYYGPMPGDPAAFANVKAPVLGLYAGNDNRVNANIETAKTGMAQAKAAYDPHIFEGAGHGFLRQQAGSAQNPGNLKATEQAWPLTIEFLKKHTR
jgi:carboxymethylenebutenolidase